MQPRIIHGTPITPIRLLEQLSGHSFCVSFAAPEQLNRCIELQGEDGMLMLDNGAFSHWRQGRGQIDREAFFTWADAAQARCEVAVAVVPDVIEGSEQQNWVEAELAIERSAYPERLMFVWHMNDSLEQLERACKLFNFVAIGSCAQYDVQRCSQAYLARLEEAAAVVNQVEAFAGRRPWIHLMRGIAITARAIERGIRVDSADSSNVARNHCRTKGLPNHVAVMAHRVCVPIWKAYAAAAQRQAHATSNFAGPVGEPMVQAARALTTTVPEHSEQASLFAEYA